MKRILCAAVIAALATMPVQASILYTFTCSVSEEFGGGTIQLVRVGANPVGSYTRSSEPDDGQPIRWVTMNDTTAVYDPETHELLMLLHGNNALIPHESGTWSEADCSLGGLPSGLLRQLGIEED